MIDYILFMVYQVSFYFFEYFQPIAYLLGTGKSKTIAGIVMNLLPQLNKDNKILLCAPSNNACDELSKRILNEINSNKRTGYYQFFNFNTRVKGINVLGILVRVGREAPLDRELCEHFLESLIMQQLVQDMQNGKSVTAQTAEAVKQNILNHAKIIVSTLNYSANNALLSIKKQNSIKFVIVDEGMISSYFRVRIFSTIIVQPVKVLKLIVFYHFILVVRR